MKKMKKRMVSLGEGIYKGVVWSKTMDGQWFWRGVGESCPC